MNVNFHTCQRIDQGNPVCTRSLSCSCHLRDIRHIGAELHDYRLLCFLFYLGSNVKQTICFLPKSNGTFLHIWTGYIDLKHVHSGISQFFHNLQIILHTLSTDINHDPCVKLLQKRNISFNKYVNSGILKTDSIQHTAVGLSHTGNRVSRPWHICHSLCHHCPQPV